MLLNKTVLEGNVSYNWLAEMVMICQSDGRVSTFSADQVLQFGWFDYDQHKYRSFKSLPNVLRKDHITYGFFEIYLDGSLTVVRRIRQSRGLLKRAFGHPENYTDKPTIAQNHDHFDYFVQDAGQLLSVDRFYSDIYTPIMTTYDRELRKYVVSHNLNDKTLLGRLVLIDHYNLLVYYEAKTASAKSYGNAPN
ncbi:hypothetical protein [Spirosoma validum]|nr:hypothetical protein [Spirosoma validum]